jgi:hypothetical protein
VLGKSDLTEDLDYSVSEGWAEDVKRQMRDRFLEDAIRKLADKPGWRMKSEKDR